MSVPNNNPKGILLILTGMAIFSIQDALIKFIFEDTASIRIIFWKNCNSINFIIIIFKNY